MRSSHWNATTVLACLMTGMLLYGRISTGDEGSAKPSVALDKQLPGHLAEVTWSLLETIEQHHISPPAREPLMAAVVKAAYEGDQKPAQIAAAKLLACQSEAEFAAAFTDLWQLSHSKTRSEDSYLQLLTSSMPTQMRITPAAEYLVQEQLQSNRYVGLGVAASNSNGPYVTFTAIVPGGAADRAGLVSGEIVLEVDGRDTADVPLNEVISKWLRGPKGTQVTLKLGPRANLPAREVTLTRSIVRIDSIHGRNGTSVSQNDFRDQPSVPIGYLHVGFKGSTLQELRAAENRMRADGIRVVILDFRFGDSSADFHHARLVADGLLDGGPMWSCQDRTGQRHVEVADRECLFRDVPLVIIVNQHTGAMQAAVAAALQDAGRAVVVGEQPRKGEFIPDSFPFAYGQYYVTMESSKLIRSRTDRSWPLTPDHRTDDAAASAVLKSTLARYAAGDGRMTLPSAPDLVFYSQRGVDPESLSVSALFPANLQEIEILRVRGLPRGSPNPEAQSRNAQDEAARKVAMQLLQTLYRRDDETSSSAPE